MFRRDDQDAIGAGDLALETHDLGRQVAFTVLIEHRQVVDADNVGVELVGAELGQGLSELAVDRFPAIAADDDGDVRLCHAWTL